MAGWIFFRGSSGRTRWPGHHGSDPPIWNISHCSARLRPGHVFRRNGPSSRPDRSQDGPGLEDGQIVNLVVPDGQDMRPLGLMARNQVPSVRSSTVPAPWRVGLAHFLQGNRKSCGHWVAAVYQIQSYNFLQSGPTGAHRGGMAVAPRLGRIQGRGRRVLPGHGRSRPAHGWLQYLC